MTAPTIDLTEFGDKRVLVTFVDGSDKIEKFGGETTVEFNVVAASPAALLAKPKGKSQPELVEVGDIASVVLAPEKVRSITAKKLKPVTDGGYRSHLLERHGVTLDWANAVNEEQAKEYHDSLDHAELKLGHVHVAEQTEQEKAVAEAEAAQSAPAESESASE